VLARARRNLAADKVRFEPPLERLLCSLGEAVSTVGERLAPGAVWKLGEEVLALAANERVIVHGLGPFR
jgi:hypothetical protein